MIPDAAIEALAYVLAMEALFNADMAGTGWNADTDSCDHFLPNARSQARGYLEAAAPHMEATEYDRGFDDGHRAGQESMETE